MKKKKKIIIISIIAALVIGLSILIVLLVTNGGSKKNEKGDDNTANKEIIKISFDTDGGNSIDVLEVVKGSNFILPEPTKSGYNFVGWYDGNTKYTNENTNTIEKDTLLVAKWEKTTSEEKNLVITFDSKGGSNVKAQTFACKNNVAIISSLPRPTKDFYNFLSWEDKNGKSILDGAKLTCDGNITLYAVWEYDGPVANPEPDPDPTPVKTYKCPDGFELKDNTRCVKLADPIKYCDSGWREVNGECVNSSSPNIKGTRTCPSKTINGWTGTGYYYEAGRGYCAYYEMPSYTGANQQCANAGGSIIPGNSYKCFKYTGYDYTITCASDEKHFDGQAIAPGSNPGCYQVSAMKKKCPDGYVSTSVYGECAIIQDATYE